MVASLHHLFPWLMHNYVIAKLIIIIALGKINYTHSVYMILLYCHVELTEWYKRSDKLTAIAHQGEQHQIQATQEKHRSSLHCHHQVNH